MTKVMKCSCTNVQQDQIHGEKNRVFNSCKEGKGEKKFRCTSCKAEK